MSTVPIGSLFPSPIYRAILYSQLAYALYSLLLLLLFLTLYYCSSLHRMVISGSVSVFFFNFVKSHLNAPITRSFLLSLFKQSGQIILGSALLLLTAIPHTICRFV